MPSPTSSTATCTDEVAWSSDDLRRDPHQAADKAQRVRKMFAAIAGSYDLNNRLHSLGRDQAWRRHAVALCEVQPTDEVLDVACGTGDLTLAFAAARPRSVTGLDFTQEMLTIARHKAEQIQQRASRSRSPRLRLRAPSSQRAHASPPIPQFIQGDALHLPFTDQSFDIVSIAFGIRNVSDPSRALCEFRRVLRPGGRLVVLEFSQPRQPLLRWLNTVYCNRIMPLTATLIARDRSGAYRYLPRSVATFTRPDEFKRLLSSAGFTSIQSHTLTFGVCTAYLARVE